MTKKLKTGLFYGTGMFIFFVVQDLLTSPQLTGKEILKTIISAVIGAVVAGFLFVWIIEMFSKSKISENSVTIDLEINEQLVFQSKANHFKGLEAVGGKLFLTDKRLIFKSHKYNIQVHQKEILLKNILSIGRYKPLGLTNNGLYVVDVENHKEKFVVEQIAEWLIHLKS